VDPLTPAPALDPRRLRHLQLAGIASGFTAGAWLGAAEAPTKMVTLGLSPVVISLAMVLGVFLARWSLPALLRGTAAIGSDVRQAPHLVVWAVLAGCLWAVANTLTIYAIRDIGLSIAFPLWNANSLLGIVWGAVFFNELRGSGWRRPLGVLGGAALMFAGATLLAVASAAGAPGGHAARGVAAALAAGVLWGTMYIPYRKAYLTGMNPLAFVTFFTVGEVLTMLALALADRGGVTALAAELSGARDVLFWLLLGGFVWVVGDLFQQYAAKYVGISRGIPLSNTNQLWGLVWGLLVFWELRGGAATTYGQVIGGSLLMALGAVAIALASATGAEHRRWQDAAAREGTRYGIDPAYVRAALAGESSSVSPGRRTWLDWVLVGGATATFVGFGMVARVPQLTIGWGWVAGLAAAMLALLSGTGWLLWRTTRFN
jgi:drug/metabolite transporter (DMT)-like permease